MTFTLGFTAKHQFCNVIAGPVVTGISQQHFKDAKLSGDVVYSLWMAELPNFPGVGEDKYFLSYDARHFVQALTTDGNRCDFDLQVPGVVDRNVGIIGLESGGYDFATYEYSYDWTHLRPCEPDETLRQGLFYLRPNRFETGYYFKVRGQYRLAVFQDIYSGVWRVFFGTKSKFEGRRGRLKEVEYRGSSTIRGYIKLKTSVGVIVFEETHNTPSTGSIWQGDIKGKGKRPMEEIAFPERVLARCKNALDHDASRGDFLEPQPRLFDLDGYIPGEGDIQSPYKGQVETPASSKRITMKYPKGS